MGGLYYLMTLLVISGTVIALLQVVVTLIMQRTRLSRFVAAPLVGLCVAGLLWAIYEWIESQTGYSAWLAVALSDRLLSTILLPLVALGFALLVGWQANTVGLVRALERESHTFIRLWMGLLKYLVPLASLILLSVGWLAYI
jgi:NSS family neurotransmitter:Na+ symporter